MVFLRRHGSGSCLRHGFLICSLLPGCPAISLLLPLSSNTWESPPRGNIFFRFLPTSPPSLTRLRSWARSLLSFSAYMCIGSCWYPFADEVVCFAGLLLAQRWPVHPAVVQLALAVALVGMITTHSISLCALFLTLSLPLRLFGQHGWKPWGFCASAFCLPLSALSGLASGR